MIDKLFIELSWQSSSLVEEFGEPDDLIYLYYGDVLGIGEDDSRSRIGKFRAQYVDVGRAMNKREAIFDVLDCHSSSTVEYFEPIFGENSPCFSEAVEEVTNGEADGCNLLILDRLELLPMFRGHNIGLKILRHMMVRFSPGAGLIALKAFPLQLECESTDAEERIWREQLGLETFVQDEKLSISKLQSYYSKLGFRLLPDSKFMVFATGWPFPSLENGGQRE